ncbi:hypothetical protein K2X33_05550 [bacterium]|nr:hypothetical protein [bacterium]
MKKTVAALVVFSLLNVPGMAADGDIHSSGDISDFIQQDKKTTRPVGIWDIEKYLSFLSSTDMFWSPKSSLRRQYQQALPVAIEKARKGDEKDISEILAELFDTVSDAKKAKIAQAAEKERKLKEEEEPLDKDALALLDRLVWGAQGLTGNPVRNEKSEPFNKAFLGDKGAFALQKKKTNSEILALIKKINNPNTTDASRAKDKEILRGKLTLDAALAWYDSQMREGNKEDALAMIKAISWIDPRTKQRYLDLFHGTEAERLYLGSSDEQIEDALESYGKAKGGIHTATIAGKEHTSVPTELVSKGGQLVANERPIGVEPPKALRDQQVAHLISAAKETAPLAVGAAVAGTFFAIPAAAPLAPVAAAATASALSGQAILNGCNASACHSGWPKSVRAMSDAVAQKRMPPAGAPALSAAEISALQSLPGW